MWRGSATITLPSIVAIILGDRGVAAEEILRSWRLPTFEPEDLAQPDGTTPRPSFGLPARSKSTNGDDPPKVIPPNGFTIHSADARPGIMVEQKCQTAHAACRITACCA